MPAGNYIKVSDMWRETLAERAASGADYTVALELLAMARWGAAFVKLSNVRARELGLSQSARWRSLERLTKWGLIKKTRVGRRKSPVLRATPARWR